MTNHGSETVEWWEAQERFLLTLAPRIEAGDVDGDPAEAAAELRRSLRIVRRAIKKRRSSGALGELRDNPPD